MDGFEIIDPRFRRFVLPNAPLERLADGFRWLEGPVWFADMRCLLVSDIPNDRIMRWTQTGGVEVFRQPAGFPNGQTRDREGRLITCSHHGRCVLRTELDGEVTILADRFEGKRLNSPNDVVVKSDGTIWFSDPPYGIQTDYEGGRQDQQQPARVYRLDPRSGALSVVADDFEGPNGLCFSPDERRLYIVETGLLFAEDPVQHIRVFDVDESGSGAQRPGVPYGNPGQRRRHSLRRGRPRLEQRRRRRALHRSVGRTARQDQGAVDGLEPDIRRALPQSPVHLRLADALRHLYEPARRAASVTAAQGARCEPRGSATLDLCRGSCASVSAWSRRVRSLTSLGKQRGVWSGGRCRDLDRRRQQL